MDERRANFTIRNKNFNVDQISSPTFTPPPPATKTEKFASFVPNPKYEFDAPHFWDLSKEKERDYKREHWVGAVHEQWFGTWQISEKFLFLMLLVECKKRTPSTPDFNYMARSSSSHTATTSKLAKHSSFMNTPLGNLNAFEGFSSVSVNSLPRGLKRSASTPSVSLNARHPLGSDEKKIISGFMNTPVMVVKTPLAKTVVRRGSPLSKTHAQMPMNLFPSESELPPSYVRETSSLELLYDSSTFEANESTSTDDKLFDSINGQSVNSEIILDEKDSVIENTEENGKDSEGNAESQDQKDISECQDHEDISEFQDHKNIEECQDHQESQECQVPNTPIAKLISQASPQVTPAQPAIAGLKPESPEVPLVSLSLSPFLPPPTAPLSSTLQAADSMIRQLALKRAASEQAEYAAFQQSLRAKARAEQERIEALAAANAKRLQKLKAGPTVLPAKSTKPLTVPEEFRFEYESRAQLKKMAKPASASSENLRPSAMNAGRSSFSRLPSIGKGK